MAQDTSHTLRPRADALTGARAKAPAVALVFSLAFAMALLAHPARALAEDIDTNPQADELQREVERTAAAYEDAMAKADAANKALDENRAHISELEVAIPAQQERSDAAARELYKIEQQGGGILELLLCSEDFHSFMTNLDYAVRASQANVDEINHLADLKADLDDTQDKLRQAKADADEHAKEAESAMEAAKEARREAQRRAREEAQRQAEAAAEAAAAAQAQAEAEAEAAAKAAAEKAQAEKDASSDGDTGDSTASGNSAGAESPDGSGASSESADANADGSGADAANGDAAGAPTETPTNDDADWSSDRDAFVSTWAPRIDAYLQGSPLAGQGGTFATAAWDYGVDPRWSPAISCVESTKGAYCFKPHNAWGWGSESWGSWEEAINAHVRGLARGYGYTVTIDAAKKYCPPNWQTWYDRTVAEMNSI